jgi:ubiquinone biosynthesis protein
VLRADVPVIERIVVASDRSETASRAVAWAAEMARRYAARLTVVQAFVPGPPPQGAETDLAVYAEEMCGPGTRARVTTGDDPATAIVAAADAEKADVLVVGNVGMSGRKEFLLGNVPNRVSHNARCTVVIVNTTEKPKRRPPWSRP